MPLAPNWQGPNNQKRDLRHSLALLKELGDGFGIILPGPLWIVTLCRKQHGRYVTWNEKPFVVACNSRESLNALLQARKQAIQGAHVHR
jgi:hypothetical protein